MHVIRALRRSALPTALLVALAAALVALPSPAFAAGEAGTPALIEPADGSTAVLDARQRVHLVWTDASNPQQLEASRTADVDAAGAFAKPELTAKLTSSETELFLTRFPEGTHYWHMKNTAGWSVTGSFVVPYWFGFANDPGQKPFAPVAFPATGSTFLNWTIKANAPGLVTTAATLSYKGKFLKRIPVSFKLTGIGGTHLFTKVWKRPAAVPKKAAIKVVLSVTSRGKTVKLVRSFTAS